MYKCPNSPTPCLFQHCLHVLTKQDRQRPEDDVLKLEVEQTTMNFINLARQFDVFFMQRRFLFSTLKPELMLAEENNDLKNELARKDELIKRHSEKIEQWKKLLNEQPKSNAVVPSGAVGPAPVIPPGMGGHPMGMPQQIPQQMPPSMVGPGLQSPMQHMQQQQVRELALIATHPLPQFMFFIRSFRFFLFWLPFISSLCLTCPSQTRLWPMLAGRWSRQ